jgi:7-cyano-7-deazaguanine synthase
MNARRKAVCLLSGGLDSATCLALARRDGFDCYALSFDYGQRHRVELDCAGRVAASLGASEHRIVSFDRASSAIPRSPATSLCPRDALARWRDSGHHVPAGIPLLPFALAGGEPGSVGHFPASTPDTRIPRLPPVTEASSA